MKTVRGLSRLTIRNRIALMHGGLFLVGGLILVGALLGSVQGSLFAQVPRPAGTTINDPGLAPSEASGAALCPPGSAACAARQARERQAQQAEYAYRAQVRASTVHGLILSAAALLALLVALSLAAGWVVAGRALARLRHVTSLARRASETTLHERLNLAGPEDELKELGDTFDAMLARLDAAFDSQRRFVASASHELRTPLTAIRSVTEVTLAKREPTARQFLVMAESVRDVAVRAEELISSLLILARSEQAMRCTDNDDLADLTAEALDLVRADARRRALLVRTELAPAAIQGDVPLLSRAVGNLIENGVRHNRDGGTLQVRTCVSAGEAILRVSNDGPPLRAADLERLFEPFQRGDRSRLDGGVGLGLSIVRAVAAAHRGSVTACPRDRGGLDVTLRLPSARLPGQGR